MACHTRKYKQVVVCVFMYDNESSRLIVPVSTF